MFPLTRDLQYIDLARHQVLSMLRLSGRFRSEPTLTSDVFSLITVIEEKNIGGKLRTTNIKIARKKNQESKIYFVYSCFYHSLLPSFLKLLVLDSSSWIHSLLLIFLELLLFTVDQN